MFHCSFCGKSNKDVLSLIAGPNNLYICDECIELCGSIVLETKEAKAEFAHDMLVGDDALTLYRH